MGTNTISPCTSSPSSSSCSSSASSTVGTKSKKTETTTEVSSVVEDKDDPFSGAFAGCSLDTRSDYGVISSADIERYHENIVSRSTCEARQIIENAIVEHEGDPCLSSGKLTMLRQLLEVTEAHEKTPLGLCDEYGLKLEAFLIQDWSIYPEVRAVTRPVDEHGEGYENFRVYFVGILWACLGAAIDTFFATRYPAIGLNSGSILIMLVYTGKLLAKIPSIYIPWFGSKLCIHKQRRWSFKEQMLATLAMSVSVGSPYALRAIVAQYSPHFLGIKEAGSFGYIAMLILSSNFMGFGIAGLMRTFLVYPTRCVWFSVLPTIAVNRALVDSEPRRNINGWRLKGAEFFMLIVVCSFLWFWVTSYLFQSLSYFDWPAWIAPTNVHVQALTGCFTGLSLNPINTFDWNSIGSVATSAPVFAQSMHTLGMLLSAIPVIAMWYSNASWTSYLPINSNSLYANDGKSFNVTKVLDIPAYHLDESKYQGYSPPFWSAGNLTTEGAKLLMYTAIIVYTTLNYGKPIWGSMKMFARSLTCIFRADSHGSLQACNDRFSRAQQKYKEVPEWWYLAVMFLSIGVAIVMVKYYSFTQTPVWTIFFGIGISLAFSIPFGYLYAATSISFDINTLFEIVIGLAIPGNINGLMVSKVFAANFFSQSESFITNQVQAHYTGVAPRALFRAQLVSVMSSCFVKASLSYWVISPNGIKDLCDPLNKSKFTCQHQRSYFNAAVQWGLIGPRRLLGGLYPNLKWCLLAGAFYPVPFWLARRYIPRYTSRLNWVLHNIHEIAMLTGVDWAPRSLQYVLGLTYVNIAMNWYVKSRFPAWWQKYTYTFGHAMDVGVGYSGLIIFFALQYNHAVNLNWWGNRQPYEVGDTKGMPLRHYSKQQGYFGPLKGSLP